MKDEGGRMNPESRPGWRRFIPHPSSFILFFLLLAGCDNNPNPPPLREKRDDGSRWLVRYGGMSEDPRSFDPQFAYDQMSRRVMEPVYDTLL